MSTKKRLIDATEFIKTFWQRVHDGEIVTLMDAEHAIINAPTVDAKEVVHGRWIDRPSVKGQVYCSECATIERSTDSNYKSRRCPSCGAKMDGGAADGH